MALQVLKSLNLKQFNKYCPKFVFLYNIVLSQTYFIHSRIKFNLGCYLVGLRTVRFQIVNVKVDK